jgi:hypothetical protein
MKQACLFFFFTFLYIAASAQAKFMRVYGDTLWDFAHTIPTFDHGYATLSDKGQSFQSPKIGILLFKTDSLGDTLWTKIYRGHEGGRGSWDFSQTRDSGFIITSVVIDSSILPYVHTVLIRTDKNGDTLWTRTGYGPGRVMQTSDQGFAIFGPGSIKKTDASGNLQWRKYYPAMVYGGDGIQTSDGGYIMCNGTQTFVTGGQNDEDIYVVKTDSNGIVEWAKAYGGPMPEGGRQIQQTPSGDYLVLGTTESFGSGNYEVFFMKLDPAGDTLWSHTFGGSLYEYGAAFAQLNTGYVIAGMTAGFTAADSAAPGSHRGYMIRTDLNGNLIWARRYGPAAGQENVLDWVYYVPWDRGFILSGRTGAWGQGMTDAWLIKTDMYGRVGCHDTTTVPFISHPVWNIQQGDTSFTNAPYTPYAVPVFVHADDRLFQGTICTNDSNWLAIDEIKNGPSISLYPNPVTDLLILDVKEVKNPLKFEIYNSLGQFILSSPITSAQSEINVSELPAGIYLLRVLTSQNEVHTARFIKE